MKKLIVIGLILMLAVPAFAQFTQEQEDNLKIVANNFDKLVELVNRSQELQDIADGVGLETVPLQLAQAREALKTIVATRNAELKDADVANQAAKQLIMDNYQGQIDAKNAEIVALQSQLTP